MHVSMHDLHTKLHSIWTDDDDLILIWVFFHLRSHSSMLLFRWHYNIVHIVYPLLRFKHIYQYTQMNIEIGLIEMSSKNNEYDSYIIKMCEQVDNDLLLLIGLILTIFGDSWIKNIIHIMVLMQFVRKSQHPFGVCKNYSSILCLTTGKKP